MKKYIEICFYQDNNKEYLQLIENNKEKELIELFIPNDKELDNYRILDENPAGLDDINFYYNDYILSYNLKIGYFGIVKILDK